MLFGETARELCPPDIAAQFEAKAETIARSLQLGMFYRPGAAAAIPQHDPGLRSSASNATRMTLFATGFRPFFLLAGLQAAGVMAVWLCAYFKSGLWPVAALPAWLWHAHEMMFGFVGAAIAGFLLTAVPNWTGTAAVSGARLTGLVAIWLGSRW